MHDPQQLTFLGSVNALIALGRIPLASEVPLWTAFGCILAARLFPETGASGFTSIDWWVVAQCAFITWATNISINYGNEYFDWNLDRPGQIEAIKRSIKAKEKLNGKGGEATEEEVSGLNEKIMGNTTRIIHDGTFPPYTALLLGAAWQAAVVGLIFYSRSTGRTPFKGFPLVVGIISSVLSQMYVGPPIRLHYHGLGELISALLLDPVAVLFGMTGYYSATTGRTVHFTDIVSTSSSGFSLGTLWVLLAALYCFEQARIFIMHIQDIEADIAGGKITFVVRVGHRVAAWLYVLFNIAALVLFRYFTVLSRHAFGNAFYTAWSRGISLVLTASLPVMIVTAKSLFAQIPPKRLTQKTNDLIPSYPLTALPIPVSMQVLLSPVVLATAILLHW
ncbi:hypothetical protein IAU60_003743 [Kwoniella sp. DSM 27419]